MAESATRISTSKSSFYKDIYHGRLTKVDETLKLHPFRAYETNNDNKPVIVIALKNNQPTVAHRILDEYESDLKTLDEFFVKLNVPKTYWIDQCILITAGDKNTQFVKTLITREIQMPTNIYQQCKGLIVLTKPSDRARQEVFWLTSPNIRHDHQIAKIIQAVYANGSIDIRRKAEKESLLEMTVKNGLEHVYLRLERIIGETIALDHMNYYELLCKLSNASQHNGQHLHAFLNYIKIINRFDVKDITKHVSPMELLEIPFKLNQPWIFAFILQTLNNERSIEQKTMLEEFVRMSDVFREAHHVDIVHVADLCIEHNVDLITCDNDGHSPIGWFYRNQNPLPAIDSYILAHIADVFNRHDVVQFILRRLIKSRRTSVIQTLYDNHQRLSSDPSMSGRHEIAFAYREGCFEEASLLLKCLARQLIPEDLFAFVMDLCKVERGLLLLQQVLQLPQATDLLVKFQSTEPLTHALLYRKLANFKVLYESIHRKEDIVDLRDNKIIIDPIRRTVANAFFEHGIHLLSSAIWSKRVIEIEQFPVDFTDNARSATKYEHRSDDYYATQKDQYDAIFVELIELEWDLDSLTSGGLGFLLHEAARKDNVFVIEKLVELHVNAMCTDDDGNLPLHFVQSLEAFSVLFAASRTNAMHRKNVEGRTPADVVAQKGKQYRTLVDVMVAAGFTMNEKDKGNNYLQPNQGQEKKKKQKGDTVFGKHVPGMCKFDAAVHQQVGIKAKVLKAVHLIALTEDPSFDLGQYCCDTIDCPPDVSNLICNSVLACFGEKNLVQLNTFE